MRASTFTLTLRFDLRLLFFVEQCFFIYPTVFSEYYQEKDQQERGVNLSPYYLLDSSLLSIFTNYFTKATLRFASRISNRTSPKQ